MRSELQTIHVETLSVQCSQILAQMKVGSTLIRPGQFQRATAIPVPLVSATAPNFMLQKDFIIKFHYTSTNSHLPHQ